MSEVEDQARRAASQAQDHPALDWTARLGFGAYGLVYLLIAWLTAQIALGDHGESASKDGALREVARQPLGSVLLWVAALGFAALVVWEVCQVVVGHRDESGLKKWGGRIGSSSRAVVFGILGFSSVRAATSGSSGSSGSGSSEEGWTAKVLSWPGGPVLVTAVGLVVLAVAVVSVVKGVSDRWKKELDADGRTGAVGTALGWTARTGYVGRGIAFGTLGVLVVWAALTHDPQKSGGLDDALSKLREAPYGVVVLLLVALGLACYGAFNVAKLWHLRNASRSR